MFPCWNHVTPDEAGRHRRAALFSRAPCVTIAIFVERRLFRVRRLRRAPSCVRDHSRISTFFNSSKASASSPLASIELAFQIGS